MNYLAKRIMTSFALIFIVYISFQNSLILFLLLFFIVNFSLYEFNSILKNIFEKSLNYFLSFFLFLIYISSFVVILWFHLTSNENSQILSIILLLLICVSTDIGGFVFGKLIGGKKFTKISPNKTYSGIFGSFIFSIIFGYSFSYFYSESLSFEINVLILIILISFISQLGDLFISFLKRKARIKDSGAILPGHGGVLDRIDGILLALPIGILLVTN